MYVIFYIKIINMVLSVNLYWKPIFLSLKQIQAIGYNSFENLEVWKRASAISGLVQEIM